MIGVRSIRSWSVFASAWLLATVVAPLPAQAKTADEVLAAIVAHFERVPPELARYHELTTYGETLAATQPPAAAVAAEKALFADAKAAGLLAKMPVEVRQLGHNLIVHAPELAPEYLAALHAARDGGVSGCESDLYCATIAAGEAGERAVVAELAAGDVAARRFWAGYLRHCAIYTSSLPLLEQRLATEPDSSTRASLVYALAMVGAPAAEALVRQMLAKEREDEVQAAALFALVELGGFPARAAVAAVKPLGSKAAAEQKAGLDYLDRETSATNPHGREVGSDGEFASRFGDLDCPTMRWLSEQHLLDEAAVAKPPQLIAAQKRRLLELLLDSKGFGLEAVKGALFRSLQKDDEQMLLRIRAASFVSPNAFSEGRRKTLDLMLRHLRQSP